MVNEPPGEKNLPKRVWRKSSHNKWRKQGGNFAPSSTTFQKNFFKERSLVINVEISVSLTTLKNKKITFSTDFRTRKKRAPYIRSALRVIFRLYVFNQTLCANKSHPLTQKFLSQQSAQQKRSPLSREIWSHNFQIQNVAWLRTHAKSSS